MDITDQNAQQSLKIVTDVKSKTGKSIAAIYTSPILIIWGIIWIIAFIGTHFFLQWAWAIWMSLNSIGCIATFIICRKQNCKASPTRSAQAKQIGWRYFWSWTLLFAFIFLWLSILKPYNGMQVNAFMVTIIMFAYILIGIWEKSLFMIYLGLAVTAYTIIIFFLLNPAYYCLWMAATAGTLMLGTGIFLKLRWK